MPSDMTNSAVPPSAASPVCAMYSKAPASGAATQGPTIRADKAPISAMAGSEPPWRLAVFETRLCSAAGSCSS